MNNKIKGILWLIAASIGFSLMGAFVKLSGDLPVFQKSLFRNIIGMILPLYFVYKYRAPLFGHKENQGTLILRSLFGLIGVLLNYYAIDRMVLSDADMLNKLSPFFTIIFCAFFLKEYIRRYQMISMVIAFIGALFIIKPNFSSDMFIAIIGVLGAMFAGLAYTTLRVLGSKEKFYTTVFYFSFVSTIVLIPLTLLSYEPMTNVQIIYLILSGVFATLGQFGLTIAYSYAPAKDISIFFYTTVLFSAIIGFILFNETPDLLSYLGYIIIFFASYYMFVKAKVKQIQ
ncbi:DMT family transporter [Macrococcus armenti]|uniref:DMT family transporter n=1 Tax=Macrococcus armenti TaxID=2875764 RepID=UPI001CCD9115|nr:DMT family transporter [Macrococcus armenti]UBH15920.1 DMT family transporter [Macrococcus armenti]UBH18281.1 DMT family transporter [Macrococcus armenti]UBH20547.1 DMT family transporter [Macrococcus armenti]